MHPALLTILLLLAAARVIGQSTSPATDMTPAEVAQVLQRRAAERSLNLIAELRQASLEFERQDFRAAEARLTALSQRTFLNSTALELLYRTHLALEQDSAAHHVLREGLRIYPHALRLQRLSGEAEVANGALASRADALAADYPDALRYELSSLIAFRQNLLVDGVLDAERALYAFADGNTLGPLTQADLVSAYAWAMEAKPTDWQQLQQRHADTSFAAVYLQAMSAAAAVLRDPANATASWHDSPLTELAYFRALTLRMFASRGGLSRWPDPLLVDLYVLDRAGYLEPATLLAFGWMLPEQQLEFEQAHPGLVLRTKTYLAEQWELDVMQTLQQTSTK